MLVVVVLVPLHTDRSHIQINLHRHYSSDSLLRYCYMYNYHHLRLRLDRKQAILNLYISIHPVVLVVVALVPLHTDLSHMQINLHRHYTSDSLLLCFHMCVYHLLLMFMFSLIILYHL